MKRGFTLIEMVVVLLIIAALTHLAVREAGVLRDRQLSKRADTQLETIRDATRAFVADMGRLPIATNGTLSELWRRPQGIPEAHLVVTDRVTLATGWRGPYLRLPFGKTKLLDPWGNEFRTLDEAGFERVTLTNNLYAVAVSHFGPAVLAADRRTLSLIPPRGIDATLTVGLSSAGGASGICRVGWYGPCNGAITGAVAQVAINAQHTFAGLTPGRRFVIVDVGETRKALREVDVSPGVNLLTITLP